MLLDYKKVIKSLIKENREKKFGGNNAENMSYGPDIKLISINNTYEC